MKTALYTTAILAAGSLAATAATVQFDFNHSNAVTQAGWTAVSNTGTGNDGTVFLTTAGLGGFGTDTRDRVAANTNGPGGDVGNNDMWRDFVFGNQSSGQNGAGLVLSITGLTPNTPYPVTIWGYDQSSSTAVPRVTDWSGGGGSGTLSFNPALGDPISLNDPDHTVSSFTATSDGSGNLTLTGASRPTASGGSASHDVFLNGLEIGDPIPEPSVGILGLLGAALMLRRRK